MAVSSGLRSAINHAERADLASPASGILMHSSSFDAPTHGMNQEGPSGLTRKAAPSRVSSRVSPTISDGRHGKIIRPCGRKARSQDGGGATTPAFTYIKSDGGNGIVVASP